MARIDQVLSGEKTWGQYALDVLGHAGLGVAYSLPVIFWTWPRWGTVVAIVAGLAVALLGGAIREFVQYKKSGKLHLFDRVLDVAHHALGVPIALVLAAVALASLGIPAVG